MQLIISHSLPEKLILPMGYHHVLQSIIYHNLQESAGISTFLHNRGFDADKRQYRMFVFSGLKGKYEIEAGKIIFREQVSFQVRSPEHLFLKLLKESIEKNGINYLGQRYTDVKVTLADDVISTNHLKIRMLSPICIYSTDRESGKTHFYGPDEAEFAKRVNENFRRKYLAYTGIEPSSDIVLKPLRIEKKDKYVTKYKGFYISGWLGEYELSGEPKYLDFLYQTGLGSKNSQGFGMFEVAE